MAEDLEIWKDVVGYEGLYIISTKGIIKSLDKYVDNPLTGGKSKKKGRVLKGYIRKNGYKVVILSKEGVSKTFTVHRLVAETFIPNINNLPTVDHINRIKTDNNVNNLRWASYSTQILNRDVDYSKRNRIYKKGAEHCNSKKVLCVELNRIFASIKEAGEILNINDRNIGSCCKGIRQRAGGYHWVAL